MSEARPSAIVNVHKRAFHIGNLSISLTIFVLDVRRYLSAPSEWMNRSKVTSPPRREHTPVDFALGRSRLLLVTT
jgi:hypothetical protein